MVEIIRDIAYLTIAITNIIFVIKMIKLEKELEENDLIINLMLKKLNGVEDGRD